MDRFLEIEAFNKIEERFKNLSPQFGEVLIKNHEILASGNISSEILRIPVKFDRLFNGVPKILTGFNVLDVTVDGHFRLRIEVENITNSSMDILVYRWLTTIVEIKIFWIAFSNDR